MATNDQQLAAEAASVGTNLNDNDTALVSHAPNLDVIAAGAPESGQYLVHLAVDPVTLPASPENGWPEVTITPGTYVAAVPTKTQAAQAFADYDELLGPNSELRVYLIEGDYDVEQYQAVLDRDEVLTEEEHHARVVAYRAFAGVPRMTAQNMSDLFDETYTPDQPAK